MPPIDFKIWPFNQTSQYGLEYQKMAGGGSDDQGGHGKTQ